MKQALLRKTLTGGWEEFSFARKGRFYLVKNLTDSDIFVSFENEDLEEESFKIRSGESEKVAISWDGIDRDIYYVKSLYVKGTGEVEVRSLDIAITIVNPSIDVKGGKLELGQHDEIVGNEIVLGSSVEIEGNKLIIS